MKPVAQPHRHAGRPGRTDHPGHTGRRPGDSGTHEAILLAARLEFGESGYDGATIRAIAARAVVDPALVHHYFGSKEQLFEAAVELPVSPAAFLPAIKSAWASRSSNAFSRSGRSPTTGRSSWPCCGR